MKIIYRIVFALCFSFFLNYKKLSNAEERESQKIFWINLLPSAHSINSFSSFFSSFSTPPTAPPREYFSLNTLYLRGNTMVHVGHDIINQTYVVFPSPNLHHVQKLSTEKRRIFLQLYFPELEAKILDQYNIPSNKLRYLYITSYEIYDQEGNLLEQIKIPEGAQYRPPQYYRLDVDNNVKMLSFVFQFTGRTAWADSGFSSELQGIFKDIRDLGIDRDSSLHMEVKPGNQLKAYEVYNSRENQKISQMISNLHTLVAWGKVAQKEDLVNQIMNLRESQEINIDLTKGIEDLKKYPFLFGNPLDPKWTSIINKISSEKLTEQELQNEDSCSGKLGLGNWFNGEIDVSSKKNDRLKEMVQFDIDGGFYIPKAIKFFLRSNNSLTLMNNLVFQAFNNLEEAQFKIGTGLLLDEIFERAAFETFAKYFSSESLIGSNIDFTCEPGFALAGFKSYFNQPTTDRNYQYECRRMSYYQVPIVQKTCFSSPEWTSLDASVEFECVGNTFLTSEKSKFEDAHNRDRIFKFECCSFQTADEISIKKSRCEWSPWLNTYSESINYSCPEGTMEAGVKSIISKVSSYTDRKFQVQCCGVGLD